MKYDVIIIGSGPGGYVGAIRCAQLGLKTAIIEKYNTLGGTCLNVGCIPSKALLDSSEHYHQAMHEFEDHGLMLNDGIKLDFQRMINRKSEVVNTLTKGVDYLMKKNEIDVYHGHGYFKDSNTIIVKDIDGNKKELTTKNSIIATGSKPSSLPFVEIDKKRIISSTEALSLKKLPKSMVIIGGGVIGVELGSVYARLGTQVTIVEYMDRLIPGMDKDLGKALSRSLKKIGIKVLLKTGVNEVSSTSRTVTVKAKSSRGVDVEIKAEYCLIATGRKPYTDALGIENTQVKMDDRGRIITDNHLKTNDPNIYAIGDVIKGAMLAHKAEEEGVFVAETILGQKPHIDYDLIPGVVYTWPEVAAVGYTEEQLKEKNISFKQGKASFKTSGRAIASNDTEGFIKVLVNNKTDEILGVHMIGPRVADLISEAVVAMEYKASAEDITRISHAHPTFSETMKQACLDATDKRATQF